MDRMSNSKYRLAVCTIVSMVLLLAACAKEAIPSFSIGTGGPHGTYSIVGAAITRYVNRNEVNNAFRLEFETTSGSVENINGMNTGVAQFGIVQSDHQYQAVNGLGAWEGVGPQQDLRSIFSMYTETVALVVGPDSGIESIDDLKGRNVDIGAPGSGTRQNAIDALGAAGIDWKRDIQFHEENADDRLSKFIRGELDAFFFTAGHPNSEIKYATMSVRGARIIPLKNVEELVSAHPYLLMASIPSALYPMANSEFDIDTVGVNATLVTSANVPDDVVYAITKAIFDNLESLATEYSGFEFSALIEDRYLDGLAAPIHPGALKYYREAGLISLER